MRVGVYLRISDDKDGSQTATARQLEDCKRFAKSRGWDVADVFEDVDISAYKRRVTRPEFERMLIAVKNSDIDGVLAWKTDRITRRMRDFVRLDEQCEAMDPPAFIATVIEGIDTRQPTGRFVAELVTAQARMESQNTATRVKRAHESMAKNGQPALGGTRAFGYSTDRSSIILEEADLIREAARRVLEGQGLRGVCFDFERRGVRTPAAKTWKQTPLRRMLMSATISAQRDYGGVLIPGTWPAIVSPQETERLRAVLSDPARRRNNGARTYLLSGGILRCGCCGSALVARPRADGVKRYVCARQPGVPNCGKLARMAAPVEEQVTESVFSALDGADVSAFVTTTTKNEDAALIESIRADEEALGDLSRDFYAERRIGRAEFFASRDVMVERIERNRGHLARQSGAFALKTAIDAGAELRRLWPSQALEWRRAVISSVIASVTLLPAVKGRNTFDSTLLKITWRA